MPLPKSIDPNSPDSNYLGGGSRVHGVHTFTDAYYTLWASPRTATGKYQTVLHVDMLDADNEAASLDLKVGNPGSPKFPCFPTLDGDNPMVGTADDMRALANGERGMLSPEELVAYRSQYVNSKVGDRAGQFLRSIGAATTKDGKKFTWVGTQINCIVGLKVDIGEVASDNTKDKKEDGTAWMVPVVLGIVELPGGGGAATAGAAAKPAAAVASAAPSSVGATNGTAPDLVAKVERAVATYAVSKGAGSPLSVTPKDNGPMVTAVYGELQKAGVSGAEALQGTKLVTLAWLTDGARPWIGDASTSTITVLAVP